MIVRKTLPADMDWVNNIYKQIDFLPSVYEKEYVAIAEKGNNLFGAGRLITLADGSYELGGMYVDESQRGKGIARTIVMHLLQQAPEGKTVYCIPFAHLEGFYKSCGFSNAEINDSLPAEIKQKIGYCNQTFAAKTLLLKLIR
ncbi:MAG: GNAT family N-acetyltransferase [Bacteroidota bacterium]